jgi:hypothetical protein
MDHRLAVVRAKHKMVSVGSLCNGCATVGISQLSQYDMPRDLTRYTPVREVEAKLQNLPNLEKQFLYRWICYTTDCSFETADFYTEKRVPEH